MKSTIRTGVLISIIGIIATMAIALMVPGYFDESASIPVHWGPSGEADRFASPAAASKYLWIMPGAAVLAAALFACIPALDPLKANLEQSRKAYLAVWISVIVLFGFIQAGMAASMTGLLQEGPEMVRYIMAGTSLMFVWLGNYLPKTRPSFFFGIRTPWTLTSDTSWAKTHRLGGRLMIGAGLAGIIAAFVLPGLALALFLPGVMMTLLLVLIAYSYFAWRNADDKTTAPDYLV